MSESADDNRVLYEVEIEYSAENTVLVLARDEAEAEELARAADIPEVEIAYVTVCGVVETEEDVRHAGWELGCIPWGADGNETCGEWLDRRRQEEERLAALPDPRQINFPFCTTGETDDNET